MEVILIHGLTATKKSNWFPWLEKEIQNNLDSTVKAISLPRSKIPNINKWIENLHKEVSNPNYNTVFIAHSLGCITLLKYIEALSDNITIGGVILISAFDKPLPLIPLISSFVDKPTNYQSIIPKIKQIKVIGSNNDLIVPLKYTNEVAKHLNTSLIEINKAGHFTSQDGYKKFPELYKILEEMINKQ